MVGAMMAAQAQLERATQLDSQATLAFTSLIYIEMQQGQRGWDVYLEGVQRNPFPYRP